MTEPDFLRTTRAGYDAAPAEFAEFFGDLESSPLDRAILAAFAEFVRADGDGPVVDAGCGAGRVTAHLSGLGLQVSGTDLSPEMIDLARRTHPGLHFDVGSMTELDLPDNQLAGIVAWYSIIHIAPEHLDAAFAEFARVLAPGGRLLLAFQVGDDPRHLTEAFGRSVSLTFHRLRPDRISEQLRAVGIGITAQMVREPDHPGAAQVPQAFVLAQKRPA
ncbi:class I SAM-dependent methyltransferase [Speluncibacter jeojiensis]|uniref:Class I SAM-dependent methyltransferase n=1 Tax=Speluncibacter jeojiensis TaxID=2710754 RepID=A0A9X4LZV5_9ACTN|nr:class I SAM-dependent methyltransferase [Corynebacteriales bacterium D3-21]